MRCGCFTPAVEAVEALISQGTEPIIVAVDGRCASGKSTFGALCQELFPDCNLFHMDDFFLPPKMRTPERLAAPGGNVHYERAAEELFLPLSLGKPALFAPFDCSAMDFGEKSSYPAKRLNLVEGSYSHHPALAGYSALKIFLTCSKEVQRRRLAARCPEKLTDFETRWIPMEEAYFAACQTQQKADLVLNTDTLEVKSRA